MKICLATIHDRDALIFTPLALLCLKASLLDAGWASNDIAVLEFTQDSSEEEVARQILAVDPTIVGLSCYVWNIGALLAVSQRIKSRRPQTVIVLGGPEVGPAAQAVLATHPQIDIVVKGEGEILFPEVVAAVKEGSAVEGIGGLCSRIGARVVDTGPAPVEVDTARIASPHRPQLFNATNRVVGVETQRGCPFRCAYCFEGKDFPVPIRRFDVSRVKRDMLFWLQQDVREIYIIDPIFNLDVARAKEICRFVAEHNQRRLPLHAEVWGELVDEETARLFHDAHFRRLEVGLQTTDTRALATVERTLRLGRFTEGVECLKRYDFELDLQLIYGLPGETPESFRNSLNFASSLDPQILSVFPLMVLPGTELRRKAPELQIEFDPLPPYHVRSHLSMTRADIEYGLEIANAVKTLGSSRAIRILGREKGLTFADVIDAWIRSEFARQPDEGRSVALFVDRFCDERGIPSAFYRAFAAREFAAGASPERHRDPPGAI